MLVATCTGALQPKKTQEAMTAGLREIRTSLIITPASSFTRMCGATLTVNFSSFIIKTRLQMTDLRLQKLKEVVEECIEKQTEKTLNIISLFVDED